MSEGAGGEAGGAVRKTVHVDWGRVLETEKRRWMDGFQMDFEEKFIGLPCGLGSR